jgi:hypothetical protein
MLLIQASLLGRYWADGLHTAHLLNRLSSKTIQAACLHLTVFGSAPLCEHLHIFVCACYLNTATTAPHKLVPRSTWCVFFGYSDHKGYRCLDLSTNCLIISRHVVFNEDNFPLAASPNLTDLDFLLESGSTVSTIGTRLASIGSTTTTACPGGSLGLRATCGSSARTSSPSRICAPCGLEDSCYASDGSGVPSCATHGDTDTCCC